MLGVKCYIACMRILIVEDEKKVAQFLQKGFQAESFTVDVAADGHTGLRLAQTESYDAIILDVMLPGKNGFEILTALRALKIATPVLMLSAKSDIEDRVEGLNLGADDYLPKPFAFSEVLARIRAIVRRKSADVMASFLTVADLRMDLLSRRVERGGKDIPLTNKEFELLQYLLRNKGRVLSRVILMEHIWDINFDSETNIVDVVINRLRRKIDDGFPTKLIHTVRGVGYALKEPTDDSATED
ncbi:MAG: transcriptional regulator [Bacteroidetes bacterium]|jgi:heavy metal response regulator|nr:transcriptional regulator [Bacteroidota bacterium]